MRQRVNFTFTLALAFVFSMQSVVTVASSKVAISRPPKKDRSLTMPAPAGRMFRKPLQDAAPMGQTVTPLSNDRSLVIGGIGPDGKIVSSTVNDPRNGQSLLLKDKSLERAWHSATMLPDGRILIFGGVDSNGKSMKSGIFDLEQMTFQELKPGLTPRARHTATLLTDGRVLIAGGTSQREKVLSVVEIWNSETGTTETIPSGLFAARQGHKAALLADGNVLFEDGLDEAKQQVTTSELFDVATRSFNFTNISSTDRPLSNVPYLAGSLPVDGAVDVPVNSRIALRFSDRVSGNLISGDSIQLNAPDGPVAAKIVSAENGMLAFITPLEPLANATTYTVSLLGVNKRPNSFLPTSISFKTDEEDEATRGNKIPPESNDADWIPNNENLKGDWRSNLPKSSWEDQPPLQAPAGETALSGLSLTLRGQPLQNVTIRVGNRSVRTDQTGRFLLTSIEPGHQVMIIDGRTASRPGVSYGIFRVGVDMVPGKTTVLSHTVWMPKLDTAHATRISAPSTNNVVITNPLIPGLELRLPAGTIIRDIDGQAVTEITITPVPVDRSPFPLPAGVKVPVFASIQPGGAHVLPPRAQLIYPNFTKAPAGARIAFWNYDPEGKGWYEYGHGTVSADGRQVIPDPGVALYEFTGVMIIIDLIKKALPKPGPDGFWCNTFGWFCGGGDRDPGGAGNPNGNNPAGDNGAGKPGNRSGQGADPVDLSTGLFVYHHTDIALPDTLPLNVTRVYRSQDSTSGPFGIGSSFLYEMGLTSANNYTEADLNLPNGGQLHYVRISPGTGYADAIYEHTATPSLFYKSLLAWNGNGWNLTLKDGTVFVFADTVRALQGVRDRYGNQITITRAFQPLGNITQLTSTNGRWLKFTYDTSNRVTEVKDNLGRTVTYTYDASGRLWKETDPNSGVTEYTYDSSHRMLTIKDPRGNVYLTNEYNSDGRVSKQTLLNTGTFQIAYTLDSEGNVTATQVTDPQSNVRRVTFNSDGYALTDTRAYGTSIAQTTTYERAANTNIITAMVDALGRRVEFQRDADGFITQATALPGTSNQAIWQYTYEPNYHGMATATDPLNHTSTFTYDTSGSMIAAKSALNHQSNFTYDRFGQLLSVTDPLSNMTQITYNGGDIAEVSDPLTRTVKFTRDSVGRPISVQSPTGNKVSFQFDVLDRVTSITNPLQGLTSFGYDANDNLSSLTDPRTGAISFTYNNMDQIVTRTDQLTNDGTYQYNLDGTLQQSTDRKGQTTSYTYDTLGRLTQVTYHDTSTTTYTYDAGNRVTQIVDSIAGTTTVAYDDFNHVTSVTTPQGTVGYTYDAAGRCSSMIVSGQTAINYTYDNANRLTQISQGSTTITISYDNAGRRSSLSTPNGITTEYTFDAASQLTELTYKKSGVTIGNLTYTYDNAGRRTAIGGSYARMALPSAVTGGTYNAANQQTALGGQTLTYDLNGNLTGDGTTTYTWNARNQLTAMSRTGLSASFQYDALGRRVSKTVNGSTVSYVYDGVHIVQEKVSGTPTANIIFGMLDEVLIRTDAGGSWTPLVDGNGNTLALTDSSGVVQTEYTYQPFGETTVSGSSNDNPSQYTGRDNDGTGLYYYRGRYYSPALHRFISEDPIGFRGGVNLYGYVGNNPISYIDPFGLDRRGGGGGDDGNPDRNPDSADPIGLRNFVNAGKKNMENVVKGAAAEALGPMAGGLAEGALGFRTTNNVRYIFDRLQRYHGIDEITASQRLHDIKAAAGFGAADNVIFDYTGNVYNPITGELIGSLTQGGSRLP